VLLAAVDANHRFNGLLLPYPAGVRVIHIHSLSQSSAPGTALAVLEFVSNRHARKQRRPVGVSERIVAGYGLWRNVALDVASSKRLASPDSLPERWAVPYLVIIPASCAPEARSVTAENRLIAAHGSLENHVRGREGPVDSMGNAAHWASFLHLTMLPRAPVLPRACGRGAK
jgi:hypothetical protein